MSSDPATTRPWRWRLLRWQNACRGTLLVLAVYAAATIAGYSAAHDQGTPAVHGPIGGDFVAFYTAGAQVLHSEFSQMYDPGRVRALQQAETGGQLPELYVPYRNLPFFAVLLAPFAAGDLVPGFIAWTLFSASLLAIALKLVLDALPELRLRWRSAALVAISFAPVYYGLVDGQNATLSLLLYVLVYRAISRERDAEAGAWAALGMYKPQLFFVLPIVFLAARRWRALRAYALVSAALVAASIATLGPAGIQAWWRVIVEFEPANAATYIDRMYSVKAFFDLLLPGQTQAALWLSVLTGAGLLALLVRMWTLKRLTPGLAALRWSMTMLVAVLINPHVLDYDLTVLLLAGMLLVDALPITRWWLLAIFVLALVDAPWQLGAIKVQICTVLLISLAVRLWWTVERAQSVMLGKCPVLDMAGLHLRSGRYAA